MRAIRVREFGSPQVLRVEEVPSLRPRRGEVVVSVRAAGVNPVDTYIRSGQYGTRASLPYTPGFDGAGIVTAVGEDASAIAPGARVYFLVSGSGAYAEELLCREDQIFPLPTDWTFEEGAAIGIPYTTAYRALMTEARVHSGETVLVHGASGGVGLAALQIARGLGLHVLATAGTPEGMRLAKAQGAAEVLNHHAPQHFAAMMSLTQGRGVDVILEMMADKNLGEDLKILARGGRVVVIGCRGTVSLNPREAMTRDAKILGMMVFNAPPAEISAIHEALAAGFQRGTLRPVIRKAFPLEQASEAHDAILKPGAGGKLVLTL